MENNPENQPHPSMPHTSPAPSHAVMDVHASPSSPQSTQSNPAPPTSPPDHTEHPKKDQPPTLSPKNGAPKVVIVMAVLVALSLIATAVIIYQKNRKQPEKDRHTETSEQATSSPAATEKDVDDTAQSVDDTVNATDAAEELPEDDLSDQTLGL